MILKNKKELSNFIENREIYIDLLIEELKKNDFKGDHFDYYVNKIDEIQFFYETHFIKYDIETQNNLRLAFWSFFSKLVMNKLNGELKIAAPTDYSAGTPQLINYGNKYDKKGKRKWIGISFDSWLNTLLKKKMFGTLNETVQSLINDYT